MSKWITFERFQPPNQKTSVWDVIPKANLETSIGKIKWFGRWRTYAFFPEPYTVFENDCLRDIANFIEERMNERKIETYSQR